MDEPRQDEENGQWTEEAHQRRKNHYRRREGEEQAKRRSIQGLSPLPRRTVPRPWEDLTTLIARTAHMMGYPQPGWILRPQKAEHAIAPGELALLQRPLDYELLMRLLHLDQTALHRLTLHHFATRVQGTSAVRPVGAAGAQRAFRLSELPRLWNVQQLFSYPGQTIQVCPRCLDEPDGYQRLYWRATPVLLCPRHSVWLLDSCPACQKPIPGLRPQLSTCPACGGDYRQRVLPLAPEASWLRSTHRVLLTHLGIDAIELGEPLPEDEPSLLRDFPSQDYFWIVSQFLELLCFKPYRERLLPLLLRALPIEELTPPTTQSALLLLHYLLAYWPVHFWIMLERLQQALEEDLLWFHPSYALAQQWEAQLTRGAVWDQGVSREQTMAFLHAFFDMAKDYFQPHRYSRQLDASLGKYIAPTTLPIAYQLCPATQEELVAPRPWEDLASIMGRVAHTMRYEHPDWVLISPDTPHRKVYSCSIVLLTTGCSSVR